MEEPDTKERIEVESSSTEDKQDKKEQNSDDKTDLSVSTPPVAVAHGNETQESLQNSVDGAESVNQLDDPTINVTVTSDETNREAIDQEKEKFEARNSDDNKDIPQSVTGVMPPSDGSVPQMEGTVETANVNHIGKEHFGDVSEQLDKEDNVKTVVPSEEREGIAPLEASAQVVDKESPEKDESKAEIPTEKAEEVSTIECPPSGQQTDQGTPEGDNIKTGVSSEVLTEAAITNSQPTMQIVDEGSPEGGAGMTETSQEGTEVTIPETGASEQLSDKSTKDEGNENTATPEAEPPDDHPGFQKNKSPVSAEISEVAETKPENGGGDETGCEEKQDESKDQEEMNKKDEVPAEGSSSQTTWYADDDGNQQQGTEGYSTTVVAGVVVRNPLPSTSSEPKKPAKGPSTGSVFKKMSFGSLFGRKKSVKDKPDMAQQAVTEPPVHDGTDGVLENKPNDSDKIESSTPVDTTIKEKGQVAVEPSEAITADKPLENEVDVPAKEEEKDPDIAEGAIVPLEEGVVEEVVSDEEEKTTNLDEAPEQDEQKDDVESPTDEDSLLRERIAKRGSTTPTRSPTKHMQMRMSYAEGSKEVEVIGTREAPSQHNQNKQKTSKDNRLSCRELGEVDHEGWLTKRGGGAIFASWKRKWVVLKEQHVYYYKTAFDPEARGVIHVKDYIITADPEKKRKFCFKIEAQDPKAAKLFLAADTQEDMDKWISVLTAASRGEVIVRKTQNQQPDDVRTRKKSNSMGKRAGSVLGLGGYYSYDGELEKTDQKRRASFGSSPKEGPKNIKPVDNPEHDRSESPKENATPSDIQNLLTTKTVDSVDAPVAMETSLTTPLKKESCPTEATPTDASAVVSEEQKPSNIETEVKISLSETPTEECETAPLEKTMTTPETSKSETKESSEEQKNTCVATPQEQPPKPTQPFYTTWYYVLDADIDDWIDLDEQKEKSESDELLSLVRTIKDARVSIIGTPLPGNEERARAMTNVSKQNEEVLKLRAMRRTLKDKQRDLMAMEELLTNDVNRQSIHEWKTRYSYLTPEEAIDENESADEENGCNNDKNKINGSGIHGGEEGEGEVPDGEVREKKLDDSAHEGKIEKVENGVPEHGGEVQNGGEDQDAKSDESDKAQKDGESQDGEKQDNGVEDTDSSGGESPQDSKHEESGDIRTNVDNDTDDTSLAKENIGKTTTDEVTKPVTDDEAGESAKQPIQEEATEPNNNSETIKNRLQEQSVEEPEKNDEEKGNEKSLETTETTHLQDQDSIDTRL